MLMSEKYLGAEDKEEQSGINILVDINKNQEIVLWTDCYEENHDYTQELKELRRDYTLHK